MDGVPYTAIEQLGTALWGLPFEKVGDAGYKSRILISDAVLRITPRGGGGVLGSIFAGFVPLASPNPYPIIVYSVTNYRPHVSHLRANAIFCYPNLVTF